MPLNESSRKLSRERWPLEFDLTGVPRDTQTRKNLLQQKQLQENEDIMAPVTPTITNTFTVDQPTNDAEISDLNNPPKKNYNPHDAKNEFPKMLYHHETGRVLQVGKAIPPSMMNDSVGQEKLRQQNDKEEKAAMKRGFKLKPSLDHDYSKISRAGIASPAGKAEKREEELSAEELAELDEQERAD
jgi:hypothetical protein